MPLPPAPTKRAATLAREAYDVVAKPVKKTGTSRAPKAAANASALQEKPQARSVEPVAELKREKPAPEAPKNTPSFDKPSEAPARNRNAALLQEPAPKRKAPKNTGPAKLFVLDTNVLMHDPMCLYRFEEHDIFLPMIVLEELDSNKKGMTEVARNARQTSRSLDALAGAKEADMAVGLKLDTTGHLEAGGKL
ncbi:MAG: PIN domain-containing protein, partial [Rhodoferax sp.]|uniref:PIN domain-containing protein n=1 Tax=Rhodoferax sp. TaxID=50421 RepID=UPI003267A868